MEVEMGRCPKLIFIVKCSKQKFKIRRYFKLIVGYQIVFKVNDISVISKVFNYKVRIYNKIKKWKIVS